MKKHTLLRAALTIIITLTLASFACGAEAADTWKTKCAVCHGPEGKGKPAAHTQDYTSADVQAKFTDEEAIKTITDGKKPMPSYKDKLSADEIKALAAYIRTLKK